MANIKSCFYGICGHLGSDSTRLARVALGSSCELWINTEASLALNYSEPRLLADGEYAVTESRKRDIIIKNSRDVITHTVEVKLVYPWSNSKIRSEKLAVLRRQIEREPFADEPGRVRRIGFLFAIWTSFYSEGREDFFSRATRLLQLEFDSRQYTTQHGYIFERAPIMSIQRVELGGYNYDVEVGAAYVTKRP